MALRPCASPSGHVIHRLFLQSSSKTVSASVAMSPSALTAVLPPMIAIVLDQAPKLDGLGRKLAIEAESKLREAGIETEVLDRNQVAEKDPALGNVKDQLAGALYVATDESGDCRLFARNMVAWLKTKGVTFRFGETIESVDKDGDQISGVRTDKETLTADVYVLSLGVFSPEALTTIQRLSERFLTIPGVRHGSGCNCEPYPAKGASWHHALESPLRERCPIHSGD